MIDFAQDSFFWYFKAKGCDITEIGKITSGIVTLTSYSPEKYQKVALLVRDYDPIFKSKKIVDPDLAKYFILMKYSSFLDKIVAIGEL